MLRRYFCGCCAALLLAAGCGREGTKEPSAGIDGQDIAPARHMIEEAIERDAASKIDVDLSGNGVRIRGRGDRKDYSFAAGGKIRVPESFPADVSLYPGAEVRMAQKRDPNDISSVIDLSVIVATPDGRDSVLDFYRSDAPAKGWQRVSEAELEDEVFLGFAKGERALTVAVDPEGAETLISISYKEKGF